MKDVRARSFYQSQFLFYPSKKACKEAYKKCMLPLALIRIHFYLSNQQHNDKNKRIKKRIIGVSIYDRVDTHVQLHIDKF